MTDSAEDGWREIEGPAGLLAACDSGAPGRAAAGAGVLVLCHDVPPSWLSEFDSQLGPSASYRLFAERLASGSGWRVVRALLRGMDRSAGEISLEGWFDDLLAVIRWCTSLASDGNGVWLCGLGVGGALSLCAAVEEEKVRGVASLAAPLDLAGLMPVRIAVGSDAPSASQQGGSPSAAAAPAAATEPDSGRALPDPVAAIAAIEDRPVLVLHGTDDKFVPVEDARRLAGAGGGDVELRVLTGAGHLVEVDPRGAALVLGWLERQRP